MEQHDANRDGLLLLSEFKKMDDYFYSVPKCRRLDCDDCVVPEKYRTRR